MSGKGFARLVTVDNLMSFAPLLKRIIIRNGDDDSQDDGEEIVENEAAADDPELAAAEALFGGESIKIRVPYKRRNRRVRGERDTSEPVVSPPPPPSAPRPSPAPAAPARVLLWQSKALTRRDLTIPNASGTHPTGSINLDKGLLAAEVDHRHYFRDEVFNHLIWVPKGATVDEATARFRLEVLGTDHGEFQLDIRHTTSTSSRAYEQKNAMTRLSWGPMRAFVAREDLIGRTLSLYRDGANPTRFIISIA